MGIPKKGSRTADVDGRSYRYLVKEVFRMATRAEIDRHPDEPNEKELAVTVQEDIAKPGNVLQFRAPYGHPVTREVIADYVRRALSRGWNPKNRGSAFVLG